MICWLVLAYAPELSENSPFTSLSATPQMQKRQLESEIFGAEFVSVNWDNVECIKQSEHIYDGVLIWR